MLHGSPFAPSTVLFMSASEEVSTGVCSSGSCGAAHPTMARRERTARKGKRRVDFIGALLSNRSTDAAVTLLGDVASERRSPWIYADFLDRITRAAPQSASAINEPSQDMLALRVSHAHPRLRSTG